MAVAVGAGAPVMGKTVAGRSVEMTWSEFCGGPGGYYSYICGYRGKIVSD